MTDAVDSTSAGDHELARRLRRRDESVVGVLYDRHGPLLYALALRITGEPPDAEDVVIEAFAQAWRDADRFDGSRGTLSAWLVTIARSRALDAVRARGRRLRLADRATEAVSETPPGMGDPLPDTDERAEGSERRTVVRAALANLSEVQREAIELAYFGGLSQSEIAERLKQPLGTIKTRVRLGMARLREALLPYHEPADG